MTVSTNDGRVGPLAGNGVSTVFNYDFRILDESHLSVVLTSSAGVETVQTLTTHYTVSGVGDASGSITMVTAPASGETITMVRDVPLDQQTDYQGQGAFLMETIETALDKITMALQQLQEELDRSVKVTVSSTDDPDALVASVIASAASASADAAAAAASYDSFDDRYLGAKATNPTVDNDGNALITGAIHFNTTAGEMRVWDGAAWQSAAAVIADNAVTLAKLAHGTQGGIIMFAASGAPTELAAGTSGLPLVTQGAGSNPTYAALAAVGLASSCVTAAKIASSAVETDKLNANAVTNAKLAQVATATIKGRQTAATGNVEDLTAAQVLALLGYKSNSSTGTAVPAAGGNVTLTHGFGAVPNSISVFLRCTTADSPFAVGDVFEVTSHISMDSTAEFGIGVMADATEVKVIRGANNLNIYNETDGNAFAIDTADWVIDIYARVLP